MFPKKDFLTIFTWILFFVLLIVSIPFLFTFFKPLIIGFIIAAILYPLTNFIEKKVSFLNTKASLSIVVIFLIASISFIVYLLGNAIFEEGVNLYNNLPAIFKSLEMDIDKVVQIFSDLARNIPFLNLDNFKLPEIKDIFGTISEVSIPIMDFGKNLPTVLINGIFIFMFAFFFTLDFPKVKESIANIIPKGIYGSFSGAIKNVIGGYFIAQVKLLAIMMVVLFIGFLIMGLDYAIILSILVGFLDLLPFFGTGTFLGPFGVICFINGDYGLVIGCIVIYLITFIIRRVLEPKLLGDSIGISAFFSLFCMFIGFKLFGIIGFIIGVPVGVIILYLIKSGIFDSLFLSIKNIFDYFKNFLIKKEVE